MQHPEPAELRFHHTGCLTNDIRSACDQFRLLSEDFEVSAVHTIAAQSVKVCFVGPPCGPFVEFVQPLSDSGTLANMLRKGIRFYHTGYLCGDIALSAKQLESAGWRQINSFVSEAFGGCLCAFFLSPDGLLIELIQDRR